MESSLLRDHWNQVYTSLISHLHTHETRRSCWYSSFTLVELAHAMDGAAIAHFLCYCLFFPSKDSFFKRCGKHDLGELLNRTECLGVVDINIYHITYINVSREGLRLSQVRKLWSMKRTWPSEFPGRCHPQRSYTLTIPTSDKPHSDCYTTCAHCYSSGVDSLCKFELNGWFFCFDVLYLIFYMGRKPNRIT